MITCDDCGYEIVTGFCFVEHDPDDPENSGYWRICVVCVEIRR